MRKSLGALQYNSLEIILFRECKGMTIAILGVTYPIAISLCRV